jgi:site-specific DNA-methyltransferase (adenine-specific)
LCKNTQHLSRDKFKFVPDLPMTETWTDEKLCRRWGITTEEFAYITSRIKEMV